MDTKVLPSYVIAVLVLLVFKAAILFSLALNDPATYVMGDGFEYIDNAQTLSTFGLFPDDPANEAIKRSLYRLPGYPAFLMLTRIVDGDAQVAIWSAVQLTLLHVWLFIVGCWLYRRYGDGSATFFVVALSLTLPWLHYPVVVHADFQFAVLFFSGALFLMCASAPDAPSAKLTSSTGLCMAAAAMTRPDMIFFPFWLLLGGIGILMWNRFRTPVQPVLRAAPSFIVGAVLIAVMIAWALRNYAVAGRLSYTSVTDTVVRYFADQAGDQAVHGLDAGRGLLEVVRLMFLNVSKIALDFFPALAEIFFNPSRWYLHFYAEGWGIDLPSRGIPLTEIGFWNLPTVEYVYLAIGFLIPVALFSIFAFALCQITMNRGAEARPLLALLGWAAAYLVVQKGIWGALTPGSGQRYGMSILPFVAYLGALVFATRAQTDGASRLTATRAHPQADR
ncbi:MAG: hypothetical protein ACFE0S_10265 [Rhodospirillales bacterium]